MSEGRVAILQVDAFTTIPFAGNPAGVVLQGGERLSDVQMLALAREMNLSETSFLLPATVQDADLRIRWFTPAVEVAICGHATVAAFHAAAESGLWGFDGMTLGEERAVRLECRSGVLPIRVRRDGTGIVVTMGLPLPVVTALEDPGEALAALGLPADAPAAGVPSGTPPPRALIGPPYLLVALGDLRTLRELKPDRGAVASVTRAHGCDGLIALTLESFDERSGVHLRMFAPAAGIDEDPVTGSAQALTAEWLCRAGLFTHGDPERFRSLRDGGIAYVAEQGDFVARPGRVRVEAGLGRGGEVPTVRSVAISGRAITVLRGEISAPAAPGAGRP